MKKKVLSLLVCAALLLSVISVGVVSVSSAEVAKEVPTSFNAPEIYVTSDTNGVYVNVIHPEDMQRFLTYSSSWWGDAEGNRTNSDYYWTEYGNGTRYNVVFQYDWRLPGGEWHNTEEWDTENHYDYATYDSHDLWGDISGSYYRAFRGNDCFNAEEGSKYYPLKDYFEEFFDGWENYYLFDQSKSLEFRARYRVRCESGYYPVEEQESTTSFIFSDWCEPVSYGASNDAQAEIPPVLPIPSLEDLSIIEGEGYEGAHLIRFRAFTPRDMAYLGELSLDAEEVSTKYVSARLLLEASIDGENWVQTDSYGIASRNYDVDTCDVWFDFIRTEEQGWGDFLWETRDVYLRARYHIEYQAYNYSDEEEVKIDYLELAGPYSEVVKINVPGVERYYVTMDYTNFGATDYATDSFTRTENERVGWIRLEPREGFWVQKVVVNDEVMFDLDDESTYELLDWERQEQMERDYFKFIDDPYAWDDLNISVTYGGEAPTKHNLTYKVAEETTGTGYVWVNAKGFSQDLDEHEEVAAINEGMAPMLTFRAYKGSVIKNVTLDGNKLDVPQNATEFEYQMEEVVAPMELSVEYEVVSFSVYASKIGNGTVAVTAPDYYEEAGEYVNKGDSITFEAQAEEGFEILRVTLDNEDVDLATLGKAQDEPLTAFTYTLEDVQAGHYLYVQFSSPDTEYVTLTINWNEGGECNSGVTTEQVVKGGSRGFYIQPQNGYEVAKITDGETEITNFIGDYYYVKDMTADRTVTVEFAPVELPSLLGDVNCDTKVNVKDATLIQKYIAGLAEISEKGLTLADTNLDENVNVKDATAIQKHIAGMETGFPIGEPV